jgi:drug/metabolite transporter (DMT)-like permease
MREIKIAESKLIISALSWGASGVLTQVVLKDTSVMALIALRFVIAGILGFVLLKKPIKLERKILLNSVFLSLILFIMYITSTSGLNYTSASNAGFIIGSSVVLVPIINYYWHGVKLKTNDALAAVFCLLGVALVTLKGTQALNIGDFYCFLSAISYSVFIIFNSKLDKSNDVNLMSALQNSGVGILALSLVMIQQQIPTTISLQSIFALFVLGVVCTYLAFKFQSQAQQHITADRAGRLLTFIPVFTVVFDKLIFNKNLSVEAAIGGCIIILTTLFMDNDFILRKLKPKLVGKI